MWTHFPKRRLKKRPVEQIIWLSWLPLAGDRHEAYKGWLTCSRSHMWHRSVRSYPGPWAWPCLGWLWELGRTGQAVFPALFRFFIHSHHVTEAENMERERQDQGNALFLVFISKFILSANTWLLSFSHKRKWVRRTRWTSRALLLSEKEWGGFPL